MNVSNSLTVSQTEPSPGLKKRWLFRLLTVAFFISCTAATCTAEPFFIQPLLAYFNKTERRHLEAIYRGDPRARTAALWNKAASHPRDIAPRLELLFFYQKMADRKNLRRAFLSLRRAVYRNSRQVRWRRNLYFYLARAHGIAGYHEKSLKMHLANYRTRGWTSNLYFAAHRYLDLKQKEKALRTFRRYLRHSGIRSNKVAYFLKYSDFFIAAGYLSAAARLLRQGALRHPKSQKIWLAYLNIAGKSASARKLAGEKGLLHASLYPELLVAICNWFIEQERAAECRRYLKKRWQLYRRRGHGSLYLLQSIRLTKKAGAYRTALRLINLLITIRRGQSGKGERARYNFEKIRLHIALHERRKAKQLLVATRDLSREQRARLNLELQLASLKAGKKPQLPEQLTRGCTGLKAVSLLMQQYNLGDTILPYWKRLLSRILDPAAYWEYGIVLKSLGKPKRALREMLRAWRESPDAAHWLPEIAETAVLAGEPATGEVFFLRALNLLGENGIQSALGKKRFPQLIRKMRSRRKAHPALHRIALRFQISQRSSGGQR